VLFAHPDQAVTVWWRWRARLEGGGCSPILKLKSERCGTCGFRFRWPVRNRHGQLVDRCLRCSAEWQPVVEYGYASDKPGSRKVRKPRRRAPRRGAAEGPLVRFADLGAVIGQLEVPHVWPYGVYLTSNVGERRVADICAEHFGGRWTYERVRWGVRQSRRTLEGLLAERDWLATGAIGG
jgi:hypothetical protein